MWPWWERQSWSKFASHYTRKINGVNECKINVRLHEFLHGMKQINVPLSLRLFSKTTSWSRLDIKSETVALWVLTTVRYPHESKILEMAFGWGPSHIWFPATLRGGGACHHGTWFWKCLGMPFEYFFWALVLYGHGSWLVCEAVLNHDIQCQLPNWMTFSQLRQFLIQSKDTH